MLLTKEFEQAKAVLDNSGVVAFPTETVMGLGIYFDDYNAYQYLNKIKNRPEDKPYSMMLGDISDIEKYAFVNDRDFKIIKAFMPGAITVLLNAKDVVPRYVTHNTGVIGIRVPDMDTLLDFIKYCGKPLLVPSANKSGEKPALNSEEAVAIFKNEVGYIFKGKCEGGVPSTIVDLTGEQVKILREGPISLECINKVLLGGK